LNGKEIPLFPLLNKSIKLKVNANDKFKILGRKIALSPDSYRDPHNDIIASACGRQESDLGG
jgi:hypothetical protein